MFCDLSLLSNLIFSEPILVFGRNGQVGKSLEFFFNDLDVQVHFLSRDDCDLSNQEKINNVLKKYKPKTIINAAAYTSVDNAEILEERDTVFAINAIAPKIMAEYLAGINNGVFLHYSTEYVYADTKETAYFEDDPAGPANNLSIYGQSKLAGEIAIKKAFDFSHNEINLNHNHNSQRSRYYILRTSWVYGDGLNFIKAILFRANKLEKLKVVVDQVGVPTSAKWLAEISIQLVASCVESGIYHAVPDGEISRYDLAVFAIEKSSINFKFKNISPVATANYPFKVQRPLNSRLSNNKLKKVMFDTAGINHFPGWREQVEFYIKNNFHVN